MYVALLRNPLNLSQIEKFPQRWKRIRQLRRSASLESSIPSLVPRCYSFLPSHHSARVGVGGFSNGLLQHAAEQRLSRLCLRSPLPSISSKLPNAPPPSAISHEERRRVLLDTCKALGIKSSSHALWGRIYYCVALSAGPFTLSTRITASKIPIPAPRAN